MDTKLNDAKDIFTILKQYLEYYWPASKKMYSADKYKSLKAFAVALSAKEYPPDVIKSTMSLLKETQTFYPSLSIIESTADSFIGELLGKREMDHNEAYRLILQSRKSGNKIEWTQHMRNAVDYIGGIVSFDLCPQSNELTLKAQFRDAYNASIKREKEKQAFKKAISSLPESTQQLLLNAGKTI